MTSLEEDVRSASEALSALVPHAVSYGQELADGMRALCDAVPPALDKNEIVLGVVGDAMSRRTLLRTVLGDEVIRGPAARRSRTVRIRASETFDYIAHRSDGEPMRFARLVPDRNATYQAAIERAEAEHRNAEHTRGKLDEDVTRYRKSLRDAEDALKDLDTQLETAGAAFADAWRAHKTAETRCVEIDKAEPQVPPVLVTMPPWWAVWLWLVRWSMMPKWREPLALHSHNRAASKVASARATELGAETARLETTRDDLRTRSMTLAEEIEHTKAALAQAEVALAEEASVAAARTHVETLLRDRTQHEGERKEEFFAALSDIDETAKGDLVEALDIDLPADHPGAPPKDVVLVFADSPPDDVDGFVVVGRESTGTGDLRKRLPQAGTIPAAGAAVICSTLERIRDRKTVVAAKLAMRLRLCIADIARARSAVEEQHNKRLQSLEKQRIPHPDDFRKKQIARSEPAIEQGADDVLNAASTHLAEGFERLDNEWTGAMSKETTKRGIDARIREINEAGQVKVLELLEATSELIVREMQVAGETLERWALDEIQTSYHTLKRRRLESLAPVASEVTSEDLAAPIATAMPIAGPQQAFRNQRLVFGGGGALSAGLVGTLIKPGVGTIVGLLVGALASLAKSPKSLRTACLAQIKRYIGDAGPKVQKALRDKRPDLIIGIRMALDEALEETLERLNETIARMMKIERTAIESEQKMLQELQATRGTIEIHDERLRTALGSLNA